MESQRIACPHCGQPYSIPPEQAQQHIGRQVPCAKCAAVFAVVQEG